MSFKPIAHGGTPHYWQGEWLDDTAAEAKLDELESCVLAALATPLRAVTVLSAADALADAIEARDADGAYGRLVPHLPERDAAETLAEIAAFLRRDNLARKLQRELGGHDPSRMSRVDFRGAPVFEAWAPLGLLVHVVPTNAASVGPLSVLEGLLTGNFNIAKTGGSDTLFAQHMLAELAALDPTGEIARRVIVLRFPSGRKAWLQKMCAPADGVAAWGGEEALAGVAAYLPPGCRMIDWGPKISFAYITRDKWSDAVTLQALAREVCQIEQQACASPQVAYIDTDDTFELFAFAKRFRPVLAEVSQEYPQAKLDPQEQAEITNTVVVTRLEEHLGLAKAYESDDHTWRLLVDTRSPLRASPLYRTLWLKPLPRDKIVSTLRPMRRYLQTAGVACKREDMTELTRAFFAAGALRVTTPGAMLGSYAGEPHDGVYALQRYSRRVSAQLDERFAFDAALDDLAEVAQPLPPVGTPVMTKEGFQSQKVARKDAELYFKSGGSSGEPKLSLFTYSDYDDQMWRAAEGLVAAGLDPRKDRVMNCFFAGQLYGGFVSFFSLLERLEATQFPMAATNDYALVADLIAKYEVDTILGMPSYLIQLFDAGKDVLRRYRGVKKVFFGGEHFAAAARKRLMDEFGVEVIRSAAYGSVDAGPLGYQCTHAKGSEHHLLAGLQTLEILALEEDRAVASGETGRLVFTSHVRRGQKIQRYEIGDLGRWVDGACGCGRRTPRFELLGRFGDVVRIGTNFFNYRRFVTIAEDVLGYAGELQLVLKDGPQRELMILKIDDDPEEARAAFLEAYDELKEAVEDDKTMDFTVERARGETLMRTPGSGKLRAVIDDRGRT